MYWRLYFSFQLRQIFLSAICAWRNFDSAFSYGFAMSIIHTTPDEVSSMLSVYWRECIIFITLSAFLFIPQIRVHGPLHRDFVAGLPLCLA